MARRSLKPQLNQIRAWVQQGRTDAWIAHQLEIPASELREFRKQHDLNPDEEAASSGEVDLRDEIEAEIEAATVEEVEEEEDEAEDEADEEPDADDADAEDDEDEGEKKPARAKKSGGGGRRKREPAGRKEASGDKGGEGEGGSRPRRRRRRGRRGGRGRRKEIEATFDHGDRDGYGLWLDPAVKDNPVYSEHWAGKRELSVRIDADQIVIRRAGEPAGGSGSDDSDE